MTLVPLMAGKKMAYISSRNLSAQRTRGSGREKRNSSLRKPAPLFRGAGSARSWVRWRLPRGWARKASFGESRVQHREQRPPQPLPRTPASRSSSFSLPAPPPAPCCLETGSDRPFPPSLRCPRLPACKRD